MLTYLIFPATLRGKDIVSPILQGKKLRRMEVNCQMSQVSKWKSSYVNRDIMAPEFMLLTSSLICSFVFNICHLLIFLKPKPLCCLFYHTKDSIVTKTMQLNSNYIRIFLTFINHWELMHSED